MRASKDEKGLSLLHFPMGFDPLRITHLHSEGILGKCRIQTKGKIEAADKGFERLFENQASLVGRSFFDLLSKVDQKRLELYLIHSQDGESGLLTYIQITETPKDLWFHLKAQPTSEMGSDGGYMLSIIDAQCHHKANDHPANIAFVKSFYDLYETDWQMLSTVLRDDIAQELYAIRMFLQKFILQNGYKADLEPAKKMLSATIYKITETANHLSPPLADTTTYLDLIKDIMFLLQRSGYTVTYHFDEETKNLGSVFLLNLFRIIQSFFVHWMSVPERHTIYIRLKATEDRVTLFIQEKSDKDRFVSFYESNFLLNIKNRLLVYAGTIEVKALPKQSELTLVMYN